MMPSARDKKGVLNDLKTANESTVREILTLNEETEKIKGELEIAKKTYELVVQSYKELAGSHKLCREAALCRVSEEKEKLNSESDVIGEKFEQRVENMNMLCKDYNDIRRRYHRLDLALCSIAKLN